MKMELVGLLIAVLGNITALVPNTSYKCVGHAELTTHIGNVVLVSC